LVRLYLETTLSQKIGLVEWLKVKALSSSPSIAKKKKKKDKDYVVLSSRLPIPRAGMCLWG
jgi:hypothetical protein